MKTPTQALTDLLQLSEISKDAKDEQVREMRSTIRLDVLFDEQRELIKGQIESLQTELSLLHLVAMRIADRYYFEKQFNPDNLGNLTVRVRFRSALKGTYPSLTIEWSKFDRSGSGKVFSKHIKRGNDFHYPKSTTRGCKDWEIEMFNAIEPAFASIRRQAESIGKSRRSLISRLKMIDSIENESKV